MIAVLQLAKQLIGTSSTVPPPEFELMSPNLNSRIDQSRHQHDRHDDDPAPSMGIEGAPRTGHARALATRLGRHPG